MSLRFKFWVFGLHLLLFFSFCLSWFSKTQPNHWTKRMVSTQYVEGKKQSLQDLIPLRSTYVHMCTVYTYTNTYMLRFNPSGFFGLSRCLVPTLGLTSEYPMCSVCACVRMHTHTPTYTPKTEKTQTTPLFLHLSKMKKQAKQQVLSIE